ncbi:AMP-binding protein [Catellatospora sp. TT07R-123]|uniref:non-ribosomal peptide synthetase n=1 Tax=Catellatospora sp. TT07R-123 TaxID=2733863 RepID=UPI001BB38BD4|nr:AMP-binding protein [Catellatospora sp. TT07R-123]
MPIAHSAGAIAATTPAQQDLWFLQQLAATPAGAAPSFHECRDFEVGGPFDPEALRTAWHAVVARHEVLRGSLAEADGGVGLRIDGRARIEPTVIDLRGVDQAYADRWAAEVAAAPFDLAGGPAARLIVLRQAAEAHRVLLVLHRIVADGRSVSIILDELSAGYAAALGGTSAELKPVDVPFSEYAEHRRAERTDDGFAGRLDWWAGRLAAVPSALALPADQPRPAGLHWQGRSTPFWWGDGLGHDLRRIADATGTTAEEVVLAGFLALLHRHAAVDTVSVGTLRRRREVPADLVGPCTEPVVLAADLSGKPTLRELLRRVSGALGQAYAHGDVPLAEIVRAVNPEREPGRVPWCDAMVVLPEEQRATLRLAGAAVRERHAAGGAVRADLTLVLDQVSAAAAGHLEYRDGLFDPTAAGLLLGQLHTLLLGAVREPDRPLAGLPLDDTDRAEADPAVGAPREPVTELVRRHAVQRPAAVAVTGEGGTITYAELDDWSARIAAALTGAAGRPVAVRMRTGPARIAALLGVLRAGAHFCWLAADDTGQRTRQVLGDLRPVWLLADGSDEVHDWFCVQGFGRILDVPELLAAPRGPGAEPVPVELAYVAYVAYTSGSTGRPKGVPQTHAALAQFTSWMARAFGFGAGARVAQWVAPEHDPALCEVFAALVGGAALHLVPDQVRPHPEGLVRWLVEHRVTALQTVPSFARRLLRAVAESGGDAPPLDRLLLMGEALPGDLVNGLRAALPATRLANLYGPTETVAATWHDIDGQVSGATPIGSPIPGRQVLLLDDEDRLCPTGVTGQIVVRSPYVTPGYLGGDPDDPVFAAIAGRAERDEGGRYYRTGDLARRRWDGLLEFRGRLDHQVKLQGHRLELGDIESTLDAHESVAECVVVPVRDGDGLVNRLVAYVVAVAGAESGGPPVWRAHLRRRFGAVLLPVSFHLMAQPLPRGATGKVDRRALPAPREVAAATSGPPRSPSELVVARIWAELLGPRDYDLADDFFAVGGHSLLLPRFALRVQDTVGVPVPIADCLAAPSLAGMAARVDRALSGPASSSDATME